MDPTFQSSFIPKRPMFPAGMGAKPMSEPHSIVSTVATGLFVVVLLLSVGAFLYSHSLTTQNDAKKQDIQNEIKAFEPQLTADLSAIKSRVDSATELLKNHIAMSMFFELLGKSTVSTIQFKDFSFKGASGKLLAVSMNGVARNFNDVIFQSDVMSKATFVKNPKFSGFGFDETGNVIFKFDGEIDSSYVSYQKAIDALSVPAPVPTEPETPATSTSTPITP